MNEFRVWDEDNECFIDETKCIFVDGTLYKNAYCFLSGVSDDLTMFEYIGLLDSRDRKIYADSSIVEFYSGNSLDDERLITGYFSFNSETLRYEIKDIKTKEAIYLWTGYIESGLSVIDTIQENKLGLIKGIK